MKKKIKTFILFYFLLFISVPMVAQTIHEVVRTGEILKVEELLLKDQSLINSLNEKSQTPIYIASQLGYFEIAEFLVKNRADVNIPDYLGLTPLHQAGMRFRNDIVKLLLDNGANIEKRSKNGGTPFLYTSHDGNIKGMKLLLEKGAKANTQNKDGIGPFHWSCFNNTNKLTNLLKSEGVDINAKTKMGRTALHNVIGFGQSGWKVLVDNGADPNAKEINGYTSLHLAALIGRKDVCEFLINSGAKINEPDNFGRTPLFYADRFGHRSVYDYLKKQGGLTTDHETNFGNSPELNQKLGKKEAFIWHLENKGWAIKTKNHFLIFDYNEWGIEPELASISNGRINPDELKDQTIIVFLTEGSKPSNRIEELIKLGANVKLFLPKKNVSFQNSYLPEPGKEQIIDGIKINSISSNGGGLGYLIEIDGLSILHTGSHGYWKKEREEELKFKSEIDKVSAFTGKVDILIMRTLSNNRAIRNTDFEGLFYTANLLQPDLILPYTNSSYKKYLNNKFKKEAGLKNISAKIFCASYRGDRYFYSKGNVSN